MYATDLGHWFEVRSTSKFACFFFFLLYSEFQLANY